MIVIVMAFLLVIRLFMFIGNTASDAVTPARKQPVIVGIIEEPEAVATPVEMPDQPNVLTIPSAARTE